ncbi:MAG: 5-formyltetrahydrofolate cyclo-ligase [Gammaproteobacteria bacterium]|nr:5-formyltetrahydrofolate cyclo-ligase [Gammaproteobacteria bacterium]
METPETTNQQKVALRVALKAQRATRRGAAHCDDDQRIAARVCAEPVVERARTLFIYIALPDEIETRALMDEIARQQKIVLIPRITPRKEMVAVSFPGWDALIPGTLGILTTLATNPFAEPIDVALVPGLAYTATGYRLGYGAGYYDRWFAEHPMTLRLGLCLEADLVDQLPIEAHDIAVDAIVTEARTIVIDRSRYR